MTSSNNEIRDALLEAINESAELRAAIEAVPDKVAETVRAFTPVLTGETKASIEVKARRTPYLKLSTRRVKLGEVYSDDPPARVGAIEYGRHNGEHGQTEGAYMFTRAAAVWDAAEL